MKKLFSLLAGWLLLYTGALLAQPITVTTTTNDLVQCGSSKPFTVTIQNTTATANPIDSIWIQLPSCVRYVSGSISGTGFTVPYVNGIGDSLRVNYTPALAAFGTVTFTINIEAICGTSCGPSVTNNIHVVHGLGTTHGTPDPYNVWTPSISQIVSPTTTTTTVGSTFQRCITLVSAGLNAPVTSLTVSVQSTPTSLNNTLFRLGTNGALFVPTGSGTQTITIGAAEIQTVGDFDAQFEQGETIMICYDVDVVNCDSLSSTISVDWGCNGQVCGPPEVTTEVIVPALLPHIVGSSIYDESHCYGSTSPSIVKLIIRNNGAGPARDVEVFLWEGTQAGYFYENLSAFNAGNVILKHSGSSSVLVPYGTITDAGMPCTVPNPVGKLKVKIPFLPAGQRDTIIVERYTCCKGWCSDTNSYAREVFFNVNYQDQCKTSTYWDYAPRVAAYNIGRAVSIVPNGTVSIAAGAWSNYEVAHSNFGFFRAESGGYAELVFTVPPGVQLNTAIGSIYFSCPPTYSGPCWSPVSITQSGNTIVRARFNFPAPPTLEKIQLNFQMRADCGAGPCASGLKSVHYAIYEKADTNCNCEALIGCADIDVMTHCGICPATCTDGGMMFMGFDYRRKNYGCADDNNDGLPDADCTPDMSKVRTTYLMLRDTLETKFKGVVATTGTNPTWTRGFAQSEITNGDLLDLVYYIVRIVDHSAGIVYSDTCTAFTVTNLSNPSRRIFKYCLDVDSLRPLLNLPIGFSYAQGDTVDVAVRYVVASNIGNIIEQQSVSNEFKLQNPSGTLAAGCDNYPGEFTLVGYFYSTCCTDVRTAFGCDTVTVSENYYLSLGNCCSNYAGGNVFRSEFRYWGIPSQLTVTLPTGYSFGRAIMTHSRTRGTNAEFIYPAEQVSGAVAGNTVNLNLGANFQRHGGSIPDGDDGYNGTVRLYLVPSCRVTPQQELNVRFAGLFEAIPNLTLPGSVPLTPSISADRIIYEPPHLVITPALTTVQGVCSTVSWNFTLSNNSNVADAGNVWFALVSPSGQVIPLTFQANCSTAFTPTSGGLYQVGSLAHGASRTYCITATYANCNLDSLRIIAGWDCNTYPANAPAYTCTPTVRTVYVQPQPAEMQATITTSSSTVGICDSLWVEATVASTQIGCLNNISLTFSLPLTGGLTYAPGSAQLLYPTSGIYVPVADPLPGLTWNINTINSTIATNGLPGTLQTAQNSFVLRFLVRTNCNMVSGDRIRLQVNANRSCGQALTPLILLSPSINITGANPPYQSNVTTTITDVSACPMTKRITVTMVNAGPGATVAGDRIVVNFGNGYTYGGGFIGITNAPIPSAPTIVSGTGGSSLAWMIPPNLAQGATVSFSFLDTIGTDALAAPI